MIIMNNITFTHFNIRSLIKNFNNLQIFCNGKLHKPEMIILTEIWLTYINCIPCF